MRGCKMQALRGQVNRGRRRSDKTLVNGRREDYETRALMSNEPDEWDFLQTAWQFAHLLTGNEKGAAAIFDDSVAEVLKHPDSGDYERAKWLLFRVIRLRCLKYPAACELTGPAEKLHKLPEPGRSALAILCLDALDAEDIRRVLHLHERELVMALDKARAALRATLEVSA